MISTFGECRKSTSFIYFYKIDSFTVGLFLVDRRKYRFPERSLHLGNPSETRPRFGGSLETVQWRLTAGFQGPWLVVKQLVGTGPCCLGFRGPGGIFQSPNIFILGAVENFPKFRGTQEKGHKVMGPIN